VASARVPRTSIRPAKRTRIRDAVDELTDRLDNALSLVILYLQGAKNGRLADELAAYCHNARFDLPRSCLGPKDR
jgi:hypothetical protein